MSNAAERNGTDAVPLCPGCLVPVQATAYYCARCGWDIGQFTTYLPFVNIPWAANGFTRLWRRIWWGERRRWWARLGDFLLLVAMAPVMLVGAPFVWHAKRRAATQGPR
ncbi:MAG: hypothetical protein JNM25_11935 [Planctomycetes bacterium]|nr:hypothetical protein [Planctomycetota bacterium]